VSEREAILLLSFRRRDWRYVAGAISAHRSGYALLSHLGRLANLEPAQDAGVRAPGQRSWAACHWPTGRCRVSM